MSQQELVKYAIQVLTEANIRYMLTGSTVSSLQGVWRSTHDIDILVALNRLHVSAILKAFPEPSFYVSEEAIYEAIKHKSMFNVLDNSDGGKIDFWLLTDSPFDSSRYVRKVRKQYLDVEVFVSTPEDTILSKLRWAKECGESEKQFGDALRVYEVQFGSLNLVYLEQWVAILGLETFWKRLLQEARVL